MAQGNTNGLTQAQLRTGERQIQTLALRDGTSWTIWSTARASLAVIGADELDLRAALQSFAVTSYEVWGSAVRFIGQGMDADERYLEVKCAPHDEMMILEVFAVRIL